MARLILDTSSVVKRCLYVGRDDENGKDVEHEGKVVHIPSAQYGYDNAVNSIVSVLETLQLVPSDMIFVVEAGNSKIRRQQIYSGYKVGSGGAKPPELYASYNEAVEMVVSAFRDLGAQVCSQPNIEADDVVAYLCGKLKGDLVIFSEDGDLSQLLSDRVVMWKGGTIVTENPFGPFDVRHIALYKALVGDSSDCYKGAVGFGDKAWLDLLVNYGDHLDALETLIKGERLAELEDDAKDFKPFRKVIDGAVHVYQSYSCALLRPQWVDTLRAPLTWKAGMVKPAQDYRLRKWAAQSRIVTVANYAEAYKFLASKLSETQEFCLDLETTTPDESDEWLQQRTEKGKGVDVIGSTIVSCGLSFGANGQYGLYTSVNHADTDNVTLDQLRELLELIPKHKVTIAHNAHGFELPVMYMAFKDAWKDNGWRGLFPNMVDSQIAATYWDENQPTTGLKALSKLLLDYDQQTYEQTTVIDGVQYKMDQLSAEHVFGYGIDDCYTSQGLYNFFKTIMEVEDTFDAFMRIEQKPMYLGAISYVEGTPISLQRLLELKAADDKAYPEYERTLHSYLISKGWAGTVCPQYEGELTAKQIKEICSIVLGQEPETAVRTVSKLATIIDCIEHEDAPLLAKLINDGDLASINDWVARRFEAKPEFNAGSFVQVGRLMYEVMQLPVRLRNKPTDAMRAKGIREGNPQTDDDAIGMAIKFGDAQGPEAEALTALLSMKSINTRRGLYWEPYPKFMHWSDNRLHPEVRQCATNTRRHTSAHPNIQQQDSQSGGVRTVIQPHHKKAIIVSLDLAGQEIRLLGDYSRDENIMSAYIGDPPKDLHSFTAAMILGVKYEDFRAQYESEDDAIAAIANEVRQSGKVVFFASSYGAMAAKIALGLGVAESVAQTYLDALDKAFPRVGEWKKETEELASNQGWVPILGGTRRHLRSLILSDDRFTASKALRQASNARIQGAGGNQIRTVMGRVWDSDIFEKYDVRFYWPAHDELVLSVHRDHAVAVVQPVHSMMCQKFLEVLPSASSIGIGRNYGELIEIGEVADARLIEAAVGRCFEEVAIPA